jgi:hypothetical protein
MSRTADYVIQGFNYQLNKTLIEILRSPNNSTISVEGLVEDVEVKLDDKVKAIQCKYHETNEDYTESAIYKPLLQMMDHFSNKNSDGVTYVLFAHFPKITQSELMVTKQILQNALASKNSLYSKIIGRIDTKIKLDDFLARLTVELAPPYHVLVDDVMSEFTSLGYEMVEVETLIYPNAIHMMGCISILHDVDKRIISKSALLHELKVRKKTAISHWTLSLRTKAKIIEIRKKQLKPIFRNNSHQRVFIIDGETQEYFQDGIVLFIIAYLNKYHYKPSHISTPIFMFNTTPDRFLDIERRLYEKSILFRTGIVGGIFREEVFLAGCLTVPHKNGETPKREFEVKIALWKDAKEILPTMKADTIVVLGESPLLPPELKDTIIEHLAAVSFNEVKYMIGINDVSE